VQITFDPTIITFRELLNIFFTIHDPTTPNRQGNDVGPQYRSAIFYHDEDQKEMAEAVIAEFNVAKIWSAPIVTEVVPLDVFYVAEDYHQNYYENNASQPYCQIVVAPKVAKFRKQFSNKRKSKYG
jgi:peptide-methionine (S)-S-oxide reductase